MKRKTFVVLLACMLAVLVTVGFASCAGGAGGVREETCTQCQGTGKCIGCNGSGRNPADTAPCSTCRGSKECTRCRGTGTYKY